MNFRVDICQLNSDMFVFLDESGFVSMHSSATSLIIYGILWRAFKKILNVHFFIIRTAELSEEWATVSGDVREKFGEHIPVGSRESRRFPSSALVVYWKLAFIEGIQTRMYFLNL